MVTKSIPPQNVKMRVLMDKADIKRGMSNTQKAQVLLDILSQHNNISGAVDEICKKREYQAHPDKIRDFKDELTTMLEGDKDVKNALSISFKTLTILQKAKTAKSKVDERKSTQMTKMISTLKG